MTFVFIFLLFAAHLGVPASGDFLSSCPALCNCKWSNGKRMADCVDKSLTTIPMFQTSTDDGIQVLSMDGNYIKELGKDAFASVGLINLQKISMKNCQIQRIHEDAFSKLNILTEVNLEGNNLTKIPQKTFDGNNRLQTIILARNQLEYLKEYQFPPLPNLKKIDLSRTGLREMSQKAFNNLAQSVEEIDLSGNQLKSIVETTFLPLPSLKTLRLHDNPWVCDCQLKSFRDYAVHRNLNNPEPKCFEPDRLADKTWTDVKSLEFACKPTIKVYNRRVYAQSGWNVTLTCHITGNPVPSTRWVLAGRVIHDNAAPLHSNSLAQQYILQEVALGPGGIERNISLTITNVKSADQGDYNCVAINQGGMAEKNITLTFAHPNTWPGENSEAPDLTVLIGAAAGGILFIIVLIIVLCCLCRRRGKDKTGHTHNGSLLAYSDPAGEKLLHQGTLPRTNPLPKPPREYSMLPPSEQELAEYGPASYVPGDRYDEYGEGRTSASNSDQTGTLSRNSYHSSDPEQCPDLLDIPNRFKQASPTSIFAAPLPPIPFNPHHPHQPLHPHHLVSPPHMHHHTSPFQRTGTLPHNYTMGTLPHHPRSVSCDHSAQANQARPGYVTLPRRPRSSWAGVRDGPARDTPSPASSFRDPIYDGVGPRTSADGSSKLSLNRSMDHTPRAIPNGRVPINGTSLPPYIPPIDESPEIKSSKPGRASHAEEPKQQPMNKRSGITSSQQTLLEENLAAYCEPWGASIKPNPGNRDSIASNESEILQDKTEKCLQPSPVMCSTPKIGTDSPPSAPLDTIHEADTPTHAGAKRLPPPTLPKPKARPLPPPKPKKSVQEINGSGEMFQDETVEGGSEV